MAHPRARRRNTCRAARALRSFFVQRAYALHPDAFKRIALERGAEDSFGAAGSLGAADERGASRKESS